MHSIKESPRFRIAFSLLINVAVLVIALFVFVPFFEEIDDTHIAMLSEGAYGVREWRLIYVNILLGKLYKGLITIWPFVRWHCVLQYIAIFISFVLCTYVLSKHKYGYLLSSAVILGLFYELYVSLQYTKTAAFVTATGIILFFEYVRNIKKIDDSSKAVAKSDHKVLKIENVYYVLFGMLLIFYGSLLRVEASLIACVPLFFFGILELIRFKKFFRYLLIFVPTFIAVVVAILVNSRVYANDADWNSFMRYNKARMQLTDYRYDILYYPHNGERLENMGITENDALMIVTYQFGDDTVYSTEYMENISRAFGRKPFTFQVFRNLYGSIREELLRNTVILPALICFIIILFASIIIERSRSHSESIADARLKLYLSMMTGIMCAAALIYFQYSGRWSHRLVGALVIPAILGIAYILDGEINFVDTKGIVFGGNLKDKSSGLLFISILTILLFNVFNYYGNINEYKTSLTDYTNSKRELTEISEDKENLYVFDTFTFQYSFVYDVFKPNYTGELSNFVSCGSWFMNSPITKEQCRNFNCENPFEALISCDNAVLIDNCYPDEKAKFFVEHYGDDYNAVNVMTKNGFEFYKMEK